MLSFRGVPPSALFAPDAGMTKNRSLFVAKHQERFFASLRMTILGALLHHLQPGAGQKLAHGSVRVFLALRDLRSQRLERTLAIAAQRARQKLGLEQQHQPLLPIFENLGALFAAALMLGVKFLDGIGERA